jgi:hypothetical protein
VPPVSEAQRRYMGAHQDDKGKLGEVAREFMAADPGGKLPKRSAQAILDDHHSKMRKKHKKRMSR